MNRFRVIFATIALALAGCASSSSSPKAPPDAAILEVKVRTEPKAGYIDPATAAKGSDYGASWNPADESGPMALVNYNHLPNIVVWVEPLDGQKPPSAPSPEPIDVTKSHDDVIATSAGAKVICRNPSDKTIRVFARSNDWYASIGNIPPHGETSFAPSHPGPEEIATDQRDDSIATLFVAPTPWVKASHCNSVATFGPLPPGRYRVCSWHARLPGSSQDVTLVAGGTSKATVTIGVNSLPKVP